jgi:site-specific DNA-methyltransferase (adenine-specific)
MLKQVSKVTDGLAPDVLYCGDALDFLRRQRNEEASLVFLDPPFNLGKRYSASGPTKDRLSEEEYGRWMHDILDECVRTLAPGGALYLYHLPKWALRLGSYLDDRLVMRHWIAVSMKNGFVRGDRLYPAHYALLYFTKGNPRHFDRPRLPPEKCRRCGETIRDYGGYRSIIAAKGVNLSDVWTDLSPVRHAARKLRTENELPRALTDRILSISGCPGGLFVDPFAGSGSAVVSASLKGMRFQACDISLQNCEIIAQRLNTERPSLRREASNGTIC